MFQLVVALSVVILIGCFKLINLKRQSKKQNQLLPLQKPKDAEATDGYNSKWPSLPNDILELILNRTSRVDFFQLSQVCTPWRHIAKSICHRTSYLPCKPFLFLYQQNLIENEMKVGFFNAKDRKVHYPKSKLFNGKHHCVGSVESWLIMVADQVQISHTQQSSFLVYGYQISFWNPILDEVVIVPCKFETYNSINKHSLFKKVMASSPPNCPNCLVVGLLLDKLHIAFCMLDDYTSWNIIQACNSNLEVVFVDIELVQERCYVLTETLYGRMSSIMVYDLQSHQFSPPEATILFKFEPEMQFSSEVCITTRIDATHFYFKNYRFHYLASNQSSRDLYLIFVVADIVVDFQNCEDWSVLEKLSKPPMEREFIIYKVVIGNNDARLVKVQDFNGGVLFLSNKANKMVPSSALISGPKSLVKENNIVSVRDYRCMDHPYYLGTQIAIFSMDSNKTKYVPLLEWEPRGIPACIWFTLTM